MQLLRKIFIYLILLVGSFIGGTIPFLIDHFLYQFTPVKLMSSVRAVEYISISWLIVIQVIICLVGRKNKLLSFSGFKIIITIGFLLLSCTIYLVALYLTFGFLFLRGMS